MNRIHNLLYLRLFALLRFLVDAVLARKLLVGGSDWLGEAQRWPPWQVWVRMALMTSMVLFMSTLPGGTFCAKSSDEKA